MDKITEYIYGDILYEEDLITSEEQIELPCNPSYSQSLYNGIEVKSTTYGLSPYCEFVNSVNENMLGSADRTNHR